MAKAGRPKIYTDEKIAEICQLIDKYTEDTTVPIISEFCYTHDIRKQTLYAYDGFSDSIKRLIEKKEAMLEKLALAGKVNVTMAIFSLKQLGWKDKQEIAHSGEVVIIDDIPDE